MKKIKVLHLCNQYLPQTENWAYNLIRFIPEVEIFVGAKHYLKNNFFHPDFIFFEHPFGEIIKQYVRFNKYKPSELIRKILLRIIQPILGDHRKGLLDFALGYNVDLVHAHFGNMGWYYRKIPKELNVPFVVSFYGWDYERIPFTKPVYKKRYKKLFKQADLFLCEGNHGAKILEQQGCPRHKIRVARLGVETRKIPVFRRSKRKGELNLIQIAAFSETKGHIYTIEAFADALKSCPNMSLTLVGGERSLGLKEKVARLIKEKELTTKVFINNHLDYSNLYNYLAKFQVFIHPSCYTHQMDCEGGAPVVLLDAQATGMPIIATKHCDIPEEVIDGQTGILCDEKNVLELSEIIKKFYWMEDSPYQQYCKNARDHVVNQYDVEKNAELLRRFYEEILKV